MFLPRANNCSQLAIVATHLIVFIHAHGYYLRAATNQGVAFIRINTGS